MISKSVRQRIFIVAIVVFSQSMIWCGTCYSVSAKLIGATTDSSKDSRHIEWIAGSTSASNYTSACDDAPDLFACFTNGGIDQPGCEWERLHSFFLKNCSHERAFQFFLESIKGEKYVGCPCPKWEDFQTGNCRCNENTPGAELMGEYCSFEARGNKYLATTYDDHYYSAA